VLTDTRLGQMSTVFYLLTTLFTLMTDGLFSKTGRRVQVYTSFKKSSTTKSKHSNTQTTSYFKCLLRLGVLCVCVLLCVFVFVPAILSWCPWTWHVYIVYIILSLNGSSIYIYTKTFPGCVKYGCVKCLSLSFMINMQSQNPCWCNYIHLSISHLEFT